MSKPSSQFRFVRLPSLKTPARFQAHLTSLELEIPCDAELLLGEDSPLRKSISKTSVNQKIIGNRWAIHPMEGWDANPDGSPSEEVQRRWRRFGQSGAKLICGGEAMAVCPEGRANPRQLMIDSQNQSALCDLRKMLVETHRKRFGKTDDLVVGFQLTHSGRFCRPKDHHRWEPKIAYRHPILDRRFPVKKDSVISDSEVENLIESYIQSAKIAANAGADFIDIKHCHGYLLHEFLSAHTRSGRYGGSFQNRTRILREIVRGIRRAGNQIEIGIRLSAFDFVPFKSDPQNSGCGIPESFDDCLPYRFGFSTNPDFPLEYDLSETHAFVQLCAKLGIKILNISCGSPYYNPHIQRPAAYPPSDGYRPASDPLIDVARQIEVTKMLKSRAPNALIIVGSGYSYLQDFLPNVAQSVVRNGWADAVGLGRMALSYPDFFVDATTKGKLDARRICRTFSDCTTAPRNGMISGCYPLDKFYLDKPEHKILQKIKKHL